MNGNISILSGKVSGSAGANDNFTAGVLGEGSAAKVGVWGRSDSGDGVYGEGNNGVFGVGQNAGV
jgi:hypothetical protein